MIAQLLGILLAVNPVPNGETVTRLEILQKHCVEIQHVLPESRCVIDQRMLTIHIQSRADFKDPIIEKILALELEAWFEAGGRLFDIHFRKEEEFLVCMTRRGWFTCYNAVRVDEEVDIKTGTLQDAPTTESSP